MYSGGRGGGGGRGYDGDGDFGGGRGVGGFGDYQQELGYSQELYAPFAPQQTPQRFRSAQKSSIGSAPQNRYEYEEDYYRPDAPIGGGGMGGPPPQYDAHGDRYPPPEYGRPQFTPPPGVAPPSYSASVTRSAARDPYRQQQQQQQQRPSFTGDDFVADEYDQRYGGDYDQYNEYDRHSQYH
jgi:hypothetical protein